MFKHICSLLLCSCFALLSQAQIEGTLQIGMSGHQGDVHSLSDENIGIFSQLNTSYGAGLRIPIGDLGLRLEGAYFHLTGDEREYAAPSRRFRGWAFENKFVETSIMLDYRWQRKNKLRALDKKETTLIPVAFAGLGLMFSNPEVNFRSGTPPNADIDLQNGDNLQLTLPIGLGVHYQMSPRLTLAFETSFRLPVSDYYDGISLTANPNANDMFAFAGIKAFVTLLEEPDGDADGVPDRSDKCPDTPGAERLNGCPDSDLDGVIDEEDNCPLEVGSPALAGCPDDDKDGIINRLDGCPDLVGTLENRGCPDTDEDGVVDKDDNCPDVAGVVELGGCPDGDGDGFADNDDKCPETVGTAQGCPDGDGDGIADMIDDCPARAGTGKNGCPTAADIASTSVDSTTVAVAATTPIDTLDNDEVVVDIARDTSLADDAAVVINQEEVSEPKPVAPSLDSTTATVATTVIANTPAAESRSNIVNGVPGISATVDTGKSSVAPQEMESSTSVPPVVADAERTTRETARIVAALQDELRQAARNIRFNTASATLSNVAKNALDEAVNILQDYLTLQMSVDGYTDNVGRATSNQQLSERRAKSAYDYLVTRGISPDRLQYQGFGEASPIATNTTEVGRYRNRRVELVLLDIGVSTIIPPTYDVTKGIVSYGAVRRDCTGHPIFNLSLDQSPIEITQLGATPEFGDSHGLSGGAFFQKLRSAYLNSERDQDFLDTIFQAMGYTNGFADATPGLFTEVVIPYGTVANLGYSINHRTKYAQLNVTSERDLQAFRIRSANGCDLHFMKTGGNHLFF